MHRWIAPVVLALALTATPSAAAQQRPVSIAVSGGPEELSIEPGGSASTGIVVRNAASYDQEVEVDITGLEISGGEYYMSGDPPPGMDVAVEPPAFTLEAGAGRDVVVRVTMGAAAEPGGNYAGIVVRGLPTVESGQSPVTGEIALPLLVTVPGEVVEDGAITAFAPSEPTVRIGATATFTIAFENTGNVHYPLTGTLQLFDGPRPLGVVDVPAAPVLPGTVRDIPVAWPAVAPAGEVRAVATLTWGKDGQFSDSRETSIELVESTGDEDDPDAPVVASTRTKSRNVTAPAGLALLLLLLMLALLFRSALQRDRAKRST